MRNIAQKIILLLAIGVSSTPVFAQYAPGIPPANYMVFALTLKSLRQCELQHPEFLGVINTFESEVVDASRNLGGLDEFRASLPGIFLRVKSMESLAEKITLEECKWYWENRLPTIARLFDEMHNQK